MYKSTPKKGHKNDSSSSELKFINEPVQTVNGEVLMKKYLRIK